jgi:hypothetical protein
MPKQSEYALLITDVDRIPPFLSRCKTLSSVSATGPEIPSVGKTLSSVFDVNYFGRSATIILAGYRQG